MSNLPTSGQLGLMLGCLLFTPLPLSAAPAKDGPYLVNDLAAARDEARKTGKPIFVVFRCEV
jgi:hypothetical protein